jgi:hypothetical protein
VKNQDDDRQYPQGGGQGAPVIEDHQ